MKRFSKIEFDQVDGCLGFYIDGGNVFIDANSEYQGTHLFGRIFTKEIKDIKDTKEASIFLECNNTDLEELKVPNEGKDSKELKEIIFINYNIEEPNSFCGFILLGNERKLVIELSPEDYSDFGAFLNKTIG